MARNKEKQFSKLNRFLLARQLQEDDSEAERLISPKRPPLNTLRNAEEVKKWIPSIKKELDYCLQQISGVRNYPERKIQEFRDRVTNLEREHKRFIRRVFELDPQMIDEPWRPRAYRRKRRSCEQNDEDEHPPSKHICMPLLDKERQLQTETNSSDHVRFQVEMDDRANQVLEMKSVPKPFLIAARARLAKQMEIDGAHQDSSSITMATTTNRLGISYSSSESD